MNAPTYHQTPGPLGALFTTFGVSSSVKIPLRNATLITTSGQPGFDLQTGKLVTSSIRDEISACFDCVHAALQAAGAEEGLAKAYKISVYLTDVRYDPLVLEVWRERFLGHRPAMVTVGVGALAQEGMRVEMVADAVVYDG
ncbi:hypothetical protein PRZ48_008191 [Zasmidium cellare]|uniref:Uncharacterized protein n=1 Tax=Zasmidium cellare TaxID=395010 RepID=A0ABR0EFE1_ZASCE|nr:hypothetical protein PRZ48_008191 [Zasmidium cellare]